MHWKYKAHVLAILSRVPGGRYAYHFLQRVGGTNRLQLQRDLDRAYQLIDLVYEADASPRDAVCVEVGTGWRPLVPMVFALAGAKSILTYDVNPWLTAEYAWETWQALGRCLPEIAERVRRPLAEIEEQYRAVATDDPQLHALLNQLQITYKYPGDARDTGLEDNSVDLVFSSNVLEHIPAEIQADIHAESLRILQPGGLAVHRFNPQDHYSTVDGNITNINFLQFTDEQWAWYGGGLAYHNRLRAPVYRELFENAGFEIVVCRERVDDRSLELLNSGTFSIADAFQKYTPEELSVDYMWMACRVPQGVTVEQARPTAAGFQKV